MATESAGSITYSEGALGGLVSPWNPMVVIFPLLLFILLCAAAMDRSALSVGAALLVGSFIVQTNISTLPLLAALFVVAGAVWVVTVVAHWWSARSHPVVATAAAYGPGRRRGGPPDVPPVALAGWRGIGDGRRRAGDLRPHVVPASDPAADQQPGELHPDLPVLHRRAQPGHSLSRVQAMALGLRGDRRSVPPR